MAKLIIAEKPSMGRAIAAAIGGLRMKDGFMEGNDTVISWCFGHMSELYDLEQYKDPKHKKGEKTRWDIKDLPFYPEDWEFKYSPRSDQGIKKQLKTLKELVNRPDIDAIYAAGDADREGEVIVRRVIDDSITQKQRKRVKLYRLWLPALTDNAIRQGIAAAKPLSDYENLYQAGRARAAADWMLGIELTRFATIRAHHFVRVGRCVVPIVEKVVAREQEIRDFVPKKYLGIVSKTRYKDCDLDLIASRTFEPQDRAEAEAYAAALNRAGMIVEEIKHTRTKQKPGRLFSLSDLQAYLCKKDKTLTPSAVLEAVQSLYEKGYVTYPRTGSSFLASDETGRIDGVIRTFMDAGITGIQNRPEDKSIYDDSKVESHSALTPTEKIPENLTGALQETYAAIRDRFLAVFCEEECLIDKTEITFSCKDSTRDGDRENTDDQAKGPVEPDEHITLHGSTVVQKGWMRFEDPAKKDKTLPDLTEGETIPADFQVTEKETTPPKRLTVETLNAWMKAPLRDEEKNEQQGNYTDTEWKDILSEATICTEATRADTIDRCIKSGYIELKKGSYYALEEGFALVKTLDTLGIELSPAQTVSLSRSLHAIKAGQKKPTDVYEEIRVLLDTIIR